MAHSLIFLTADTTEIHMTAQQQHILTQLEQLNIWDVYWTAQGNLCMINDWDHAVVHSWCAEHAPDVECEAATTPEWA